MTDSAASTDRRPRRLAMVLDLFPVDRIGRGLWLDLGLTVAAGAVFAAFALYLFNRIDYAVMCGSMDTWLDADATRVVSAISSRFNWMHFRSNVHPLWSLLTVSPFIALGALVGLKSAVASYVAAQAFALGAAFFATTRAFRIGRIDSALSAGLLLSTAACWFWLPVPEIHVFGAASLMVPIFWALMPRGAHDAWSGPAQSAIALSMTFTHWVGGLAAAFLALGVKRGLRATAFGFSAVGALAMIQYYLFPNTGKFLNIWTEEVYLEKFSGGRGTLLEFVQTAFLKTLAAPTPQFWKIGDPAAGELFSRMQFAPPPTSALALGYYGLWAVLAGLGLWAAARHCAARLGAAVVGVILAFYLALHSFFGVETFFFAMHFVPFFALVAAWSLSTPGVARHGARIAMAVAIVLGMAHNQTSFAATTQWFNGLSVDEVRFEGGAPCG